MSALPPLLLRGDCLARLADIPDASIDAVVTDPPYGLDFMGKAWDRYTPLDFEQWCASWALECLRILKPGGHLLAFGGSRTWHRLAVGIEDAGFEIRDSIAWLYGSGFPKSLDVSKAIDKAAGAEREPSGAATSLQCEFVRRGEPCAGHEGETATSQSGLTVHSLPTAPATDAAREWQGWGTALKPAFEPIVVARKPLGERTVAANVLRHGTGALNIDATRVGSESAARKNRAAIGHDEGMGVTARSKSAEYSTGSHSGRWPANVVLDEPQAAALDAQTGVLTSGANPKRRGADGDRAAFGAFAGQDEARPARGVDTGGASRFFYVAKAPKSERPVTVDPDTGDRVAHPTVKPLVLMRWLLRLVTPPGGCIVDPFAGSGTTLEAAYLEGFESIGVELTPDYWPLIEARITRAVAAREEANDD